jgi:hypothetical protein
MNYNRRTTRPDGLHYRETRKHVGSSRPWRRGRGGMGPVVLVVAVVVVAGLVVFWVFRR